MINVYLGVVTVSFCLIVYERVYCYFWVYTVKTRVTIKYVHDKGKLRVWGLLSNSMCIGVDDEFIKDILRFGYCHQGGKDIRDQIIDDHVTKRRNDLQYTIHVHLYLSVYLQMIQTMI